MSSHEQCNMILGLALLNDNVDFKVFPVTRSLVQLMSWIELHMLSACAALKVHLTLTYGMPLSSTGT